MFTVKLLGRVNNVNVALEMMHDFAAPQNGDDLQRLIDSLPGNPNRNICLWLLNLALDISAPASWWNQLKQYDIGIFLLRQQRRSDGSQRFLDQSDFEGSISDEKLAILNNYIRDEQYETLQRLLPSNIVQRGFIQVSYKTLNDIYCERSSTATSHWETFLRYLETLPYHDVITKC